ncbi:MAG TPA: hypothetical protein VIB47_00975, partial [Dehalococcoidia bacterium]
MTTETAKGVRSAATHDSLLSRPQHADPYAAPFVAQPQTIEESGLDFSMVLDLVVKSIYFSGRPSARQICAQVALQFSVLDEVLAFLKREQMAEVVGSSGMGEQLYQYSLTAKGFEKADEALNRNHYIGPAPVNFTHYLEILQRQTVRTIRVDPETVDQAMSHLVLSPEVPGAL